LGNLLEKLAAFGRIKNRFVRLWSGMHQVVEITGKWLEDCRSLLKKFTV